MPSHRTSSTRTLSPKHAAAEVIGRPSGAKSWRATVAEHVAELRIGSALRVDFVLPRGYWVDLDTLLDTTCAGLRDAGALAPRYAGLDVAVATKAFGPRPHAVVRAADPASVLAADPGRALVDVGHPAVPRPGNTGAKRAWRQALAVAWGDRPPLSGRVWADVQIGVPGSLLGPLEVVLDALEPVLGRDPRGRAWQEFFPNDDRIEWLRVSRANQPGVRLALGSN